MTVLSGPEAHPTTNHHPTPALSQPDLYTKTLLLHILPFSQWWRHGHGLPEGKRGSNPRLEYNNDQVLDIPVTPTVEIRQQQYALISPSILTAAIIASWYPIFLTMLHMSCATYSLLAIKWLEIVPFQQIHSRKQFFKIFALSVIFCFSVVCGNTSLRYLPVSFNQAIGAATTFFTAIFAFVITCKKESAEVYLALVPVVLGIVLASNSEPLLSAEEVKVMEKIPGFVSVQVQVV
ncbi:probable sugar phosphate/phosphate translocator At1g12500 [Olea europaea var. sylvestris]|uniref:probable sugar phosphate/phosphate translocator At1g12500 n=1 Tax=Olea europaea var. sylvestris TaxID=158386 RepID=UPI000C1CFC0C|nr:probable sugar phosphate/phosphate translocator At1g12500 [Olea europaea var. sylvestris]